jgi:hypothetical protein
MDTPDLTYTRQGNTWLFSDGTTIPVVSGGIDEGGATAAPDINTYLDNLDAAGALVDEPAEGKTPPAPAPAPAPATPPAPTGDAPTDDPFDKGADSFDRAYVEKLRQESARYRTEAKTFKEAFDGLDQGDQQAFLELAQLYKTDPNAAGKWMRENGDALLAAIGGSEEPPIPTGDDDKPLTRAELNKILADQERSRTESAAVQSVNQQVTELGLDPASHAGKALMLRALDEHDGDIAAAHKAITDEQAAAKKAAIDEYLAGKAAGADTPTPVIGSGAAGEADKKPANVTEATQMLLARLNAQD